MRSTAILAILAAAVSANYSMLREDDFPEKAEQGEYSDPNHPGCPRALVVYDSTSGAMYGNDDCTDLTEPWGPLPVTIDSFSLVCDFSSKGGPSDLAGTYKSGSADLGTITWADGNVWTQTLH